MTLGLDMLTKGFFLASALAGCALLLFRSSALQTPASLRANKVVVMKSQRTLTLLSDDHVLKPIGLRWALIRWEQKHQGDGKTPEGHYLLDRRNPKSRFHLSLHVSYPDAADMARARKLGVAPGGDIFVHGLPGGWGWLESQHRRWDWTDGCIAVTNAEIEEIWHAVPDGTPIEITP